MYRVISTGLMWRQCVAYLQVLFSTDVKPPFFLACLFYIHVHVGYCSHTLRIGFHYETHIGISPYRTWSCEKLIIFCAIWENTANVQWIRCSPKGSHLIHWTSAVFPHIALKWTPSISVHWATLNPTKPIFNRSCARLNIYFSNYWST